MKLGKAVGCLAVLLLLGGGTARADEVIYLTNGSAMRAQSHEISGQMIRVVVGPNATIAFPIHLVEKIERGGVSVFPVPEAGLANRVAPSDGAPSAAVRTADQQFDFSQDGSANVPSRFRSRSSRRSQWMDPLEQAAQAQRGGGLGEGTPAPGPAGRFLRSMAPRPGEQNTGPIGTTPLGNHYAIASSPDPRARSSRGPIVSIAPKPGVASGTESAPPAGEPPSEEGGAPPEESGDPN